MYEEEQMIEMKLESFQALTPTKKFETTNQATGLSYSEDGKGLIVAGETCVHVYNLNGGTHRPIESAKYGVGVVEYLDSDHCLHSSTKIDNKIRLLNLNTKAYTRYFSGHHKLVVGIKVRPQDDSTFLTASQDHTIRLWDYRNPDNFGCINFQNVPLVAYDPMGVCFAVATRNETVKLFDVRSFDLGPFKTFRIMKNDDEEWTNIEFSPCGKFILISTKADGVKWIDAFVGKLLHNFTGHRNSHKIPLQATVSPDSSLVFVGSDDRNVYAYSTETGHIAFTLPTSYLNVSHVVAFNPKQFLMTSLSMSREVILWAPSEDYAT